MSGLAPCLMVQGTSSGVGESLLIAALCRIFAVRSVPAALLTLALLAATTCEAGALALRDMLGREVTLAAPPARIVSLVPSVTEVIFALGAQDRLVGRTDYCDYPPAAASRPSVGGMINPSLERIVSLKPDLVVATDEGNREETIQQLRRVGLPVYLVHATRVSEMLQVIERVGEVTGRQAAVPALVADITRRIDAVRAAVRPFPPPRVLYVLWPDPLIVPGRRAHLTEMIELAGGRSITADDGEAYPRFSLEAAVARAPEVIILADHAGGGSAAGKASPEQWARLTSVPAIQAGRIHSVDLGVLHRYGPRVAEGLESLARIIHPEAFR